MVEVKVVEHEGTEQRPKGVQRVASGTNAFLCLDTFRYVSKCPGKYLVLVTLCEIRPYLFKT